jgi:hypothetical protein
VLDGNIEWNAMRLAIHRIFVDRNCTSEKMRIVPKIVFYAPTHTTFAVGELNVNGTNRSTDDCILFRFEEGSVSQTVQLCTGETSCHAVVDWSNPNTNTPTELDGSKQSGSFTCQNVMPKYECVAISRPRSHFPHKETSIMSKTRKSGQERHYQR